MELKNLAGNVIYSDKTRSIQRFINNIRINNPTNKTDPTVVYTNIDFKGMHLFGVDFHNAHFACCDFSNANLAAANFINCQFYSCDFNEAKLLFTQFSHCILKHCEANGVNISGTSFNDSSLINFRVQNANQQNSIYINRTRVEGMTFIPAKAFISDSTIRTSIFQEPPSPGGEDYPVTPYILTTLITECTDVTLLGTRSDGYVFYNLFNKYIRAGCRSFTLKQAYKHWGDPDYPNGELLRQESLMFLDNATKLINLQY